MCESRDHSKKESYYAREKRDLSATLFFDNVSLEPNEIDIENNTQYYVHKKEIKQHKK